MVFGFSWGEVALILGASAALFGPKDIVIIGRAAGRMTGKAVGYIQNARGHIAPIMQRSEINTVHKELRETMAQLEAIRHEMRTGISIMNPGPMTSQVFENSVPGHSAPLRSSEKGADDMPDLSQRAPVNQAISGVLNQVSPTQIVMQMQSLEAASKQDKPAETVISTASVIRSYAEGSPVGLASVIQVSQESKHPAGIVGGAPGQELVVLPISAVEAGLLKKEPILGGADIVFASIVERKVAFQSQKFLMEGET
ncbi:hypothetical protein M758_6G062000 [Ceratodon purpureus]|nr:hypothetical protein M758_6G062000 [Ceratodon purpureus]